jgi:serine/threonine protein kinase
VKNVGFRQGGLVHRDIKPSNLMLDSHGQVKILDLGLAMVQPGQLVGTERITASGQTMGTVDYMAPKHRSLRCHQSQTASGVMGETSGRAGGRDFYYFFRTT